MRLLPLLFVLAGCDSVVYGSGALYLYNGTEHAMSLRLEGRTPIETRLKPERGELFAEMVAGPYVVHTGERTIDAEIKADQLTIVNAEAPGCFARLDVIGMYQPGKERARVLQLYSDEEIMSVPDSIAVPPGERLPLAAPKTPFAYQRMIVVPCHLLEEDEQANRKVAEYARRVR